jgi:hypothetical protein
MNWRIKIYLQEVDWIAVAQDRDSWPERVNAVMNCGVP